MRVEALVDVVETPQHPLLEPCNVVSHIENTGFYLFESSIDLGEARVDLGEAVGDRGVEGAEAAQDFFVIHPMMIRHRDYVTVSEVCPD